MSAFRAKSTESVHASTLTSSNVHQLSTYELRQELVRRDCLDIPEAAINHNTMLQRLIQALVVEEANATEAHTAAVVDKAQEERDAGKAVRELRVELQAEPRTGPHAEPQAEPRADRWAELRAEPWAEPRVELWAAVGGVTGGGAGGAVGGPASGAAGGEEGGVAHGAALLCTALHCPALHCAALYHHTAVQCRRLQYSTVTFLVCEDGACILVRNCAFCHNVVRAG